VKEFTMEHLDIDTTVSPSGSGCVECERQHGWWFHLRRCALCGHIGCCDNSPGQHATAHFRHTGHRLITSFEPDEDWFYDYGDQQLYSSGPRLAPPEQHPLDQPTPGPAGLVPRNWQQLLH
jgi:hypothetical protein